MGAQFRRVAEDEAPSPWQTESYGTDPVPQSGRHLSLSAVLWTWLAASIGILGVATGSGLVTGLHLNYWQALLVATIGAAGSFAFVALVSLAGPMSGAPTLIASRATFGVRGNLAPAVVSWVVLTGLEIVMCTTATFAVSSVFELLGWPTGVWLTAPVAVLLVGGAVALAFFGHPLIMFVQKWFGWVLGIVTVVMCVIALSTLDWGLAMAMPPADFSAVVAGIGVVAAGTGVSWMSAGADYTRYLPQSTAKRSLFAVTGLGAVVPLVVIISAGASLALGNADAVGLALPDWLLIPYLVVAVLGLLTAADLAMYSSGLSLQAAGVPLPRRFAALATGAVVLIGTLLIVIVGAVTGGDGMTAVFGSIVSAFELPLVAWVGVFGLDLILRRNLFDGDLTDTSPQSDYWFRSGFHWPAIGAWLAAIALGLLFTRMQSGEAVWFAGPLAETWLGRNSLGWLVAGISASAIYWVLEPLTRSHQPGRAHDDDL